MILAHRWAILGAILLTCRSATAAEAEPEDLYYSQQSLARARDACKNVKFENAKVSMVFGPQPAQNPNIETVALRVYRDANGKPTKVVIRLVIAGTNPPVPANYHVLTPADSDFRELAARLLLDK